MRSAAFRRMERNIARCRLALSAFALVAVFIDPTLPTLTRWIPLTGGAFSIDPYTLAVMGGHFCYSLALLAILAYELVSPKRVDGIAVWLDVLFGAAIAAVTEGATSPFYAFFAFAVVEAGLIGGFRRAMTVTALSVGLYLSLILLSAPGNANLYVMRPIYLSIVGYLVGYIGQQRLNLEAAVRELAVSSQRQRIARDLHDGRAQVLAGVTLRLATCQELLRRGRTSDALLEISDLQAGVDQEYHDFRAYIRSLAGVQAVQVPTGGNAQTLFSISTQFTGSAVLAHHVLRILDEGITNVARHAHARSAEMRVHPSGANLQITMDDDGVGFRNPGQQPWSIASRVAESGGRMQVICNGKPGAHLAITLPQN
jgi:signal transduction histidine kinase